MVLQNETDYTESSSGHDPPGSGSCFNGGSGLAQERRMERRSFRRPHTAGRSSAPVATECRHCNTDSFTPRQSRPEAWLESAGQVSLLSIPARSPLPPSRPTAGISFTPVWPGADSEDKLCWRSPPHSTPAAGEIRWTLIQC